MAQQPKYYVVEAAALPEIFLKVAEAKRLLSTGQAETVNDAAHMIGISRSAFYKYRDTIMPFHNLLAGRIINLQLVPKNEPGALSNVLNTLTDAKMNLLTINSNIPTNGAALVTITAETNELSCTMEELLQSMRERNGVVKAEIVAG